MNSATTSTWPAVRSDRFDPRFQATTSSAGRFELTQLAKPASISLALTSTGDHSPTIVDQVAGSWLERAIERPESFSYSLTRTM